MSVTGEPDAPLKLYGNQAYHTASLFAANGILLALWQRHATGRGQYIDISIMECVAATLDHVLVRYFYEGIVSGRQGSRHWNNAFRDFPLPGRLYPAFAPPAVGDAGGVARIRGHG